MRYEWDKLSKEDLDHHASPSQWNKRFTPGDSVQHFVQTISAGTETTKRCTQHECDVSYGEGKMQSMDIYLPVDEPEDAPILVFFHGGYWQSTRKEQYGLVAKHPAKLGAVVAVVGYTLAPAGTLPQMLCDAERAVSFLAKRFPKTRGFYLCGHSAGSQLAAMMLSVEWSTKYGLPKDFIKGACLISGVFDVQLIVKTYVNDPLHLTEEDAYRVSPITEGNLSEAVRLCSHCRVVNVCGEHDPPMFKQMTADYTKELAQAGLDATHELIPEMDHFELVERLVEAEHRVTKILLDVMSL